MQSKELINKLKNNFHFSISSIEELSQYEYYWGYSSISSYKKIEKSIDKYLKAVLKFNYSDFDESDFDYLKRSNGGERPLFDHECFFLQIYEDKGKVINIREKGYTPLSLSKKIDGLLPDDEDPKDKYGFSNF